MFVAEFLVVLFAIFLGVRLGGMAIGYAGGLGVVVLSLLFGLKPGDIPIDVILIIMSVIAAITAMQMAGGLTYLVQIAEKILRKNPKHINYLAPSVVYFLTILSGTGHTVFSLIPVITELAKGQDIKPSLPLSISVVASQIAITASPVSAAVVFLSGVLEPLGVSYPMLLAICIPTTFLGCMLTAFVMSSLFHGKLSDDPIYQERLKAGLIKPVSDNKSQEKISKEAKLSLWIFLAGVVAVVFYATAISKNVALIEPVVLERNQAIMTFMLCVGVFITLFCKLDSSSFVHSSIFKSGMVACICVLGVAWLGDTFVNAHVDDIKTIASSVVSKYPFLLAFVFAFASMLLYSQAATAEALIPPVILALGISSAHTDQVYVIVASFSAVSALFVLPTYPTLLGAVQMDDTGSTRIGKYIFNHAFLLPGILAIVFSVSLGFVLAPMLL